MDEYCQNSLDLACSGKNVAIARALLDSGADIDTLQSREESLESMDEAYPHSRPKTEPRTR